MKSTETAQIWNELSPGARARLACFTVLKIYETQDNADLLVAGLIALQTIHGETWAATSRKGARVLAYGAAVPNVGDTVVDQDQRGQHDVRQGVVEAVSATHARICWQGGRTTLVKIDRFTTIQASRGYRIVARGDDNKEKKRMT